MSAHFPDIAVSVSLTGVTIRTPMDCENRSHAPGCV